MPVECIRISIVKKHVRNLDMSYLYIVEHVYNYCGRLLPVAPTHKARSEPEGASLPIEKKTCRHARPLLAFESCCLDRSGNCVLV